MIHYIFHSPHRVPGTVCLTQLPFMHAVR
uniref:Uncharacterized protein n=1 Tax=Anguilla anguilla TaxID=7936 RepID=A0A0E9PRV8_ANGAN